jgi:DNA-binding transcriptional MerR regulator
MKTTYRPIDLARLAGVSTASVRMYEREGFLPEVERRNSGHRRYGDVHLDALLTARAMMKGYGWAYAKRVMQAVNAGDVAAALSLVDARHAALHRERTHVAVTIQALEIAVEHQASVNQTLSATSATPPMRIGAAARWAGVEASSLRFWEHQSLLHPYRDPGSNYRLYGADDLRQLRIIVILRNAGYGMDDVRRVLDELRQDHPEAVLTEVRKRQDQLTQISLACMQATAALSGYLAEHCDCSAGT